MCNKNFKGSDCLVDAVDTLGSSSMDPHLLNQPHKIKRGKKKSK